MTMTELMRYISSTKIAGVLPLDWVLHFTVGAILTIVLLKLKVKLSKAVLILAIVELCKEIYDYQAMTATLTEAVLDYLITMAYPFFLYLTRNLKEKLRDMD